MKPVIVFDHVSKQYRKYGNRSLRDALSGLGRRLLPGSKAGSNNDEVFWAVQDLSFEIQSGQTIGIIGPNGAGKTTTLKLLSRITQPTGGRIQVDGRISALIELSAGFHPELTGRENVFLNGTILGMSRQEISQRFDDIVDFAGLSKFMDTPVKYYSSGMYARLGFAVAAHTNPDVLVVDEVLAVGDYAFQQRCYERMRWLKDQGSTVLLVSHNLAVVTDVCEEVIVLNQGQSVFRGPASEAVAEYANLIRRAATKDSIPIGDDGIGQRVMTHAAKIVDVQLLNQTNQPITVAAPGERVKVAATVEFYEDAPHPNFACFVRDEQGRLIYDQTTLWQGTATPNFSAGETATVIYDIAMNVVKGIYQIGIDLHYQDLSCFYDRLESAASLVVTGDDGAKGISNLDCRFLFEERTLAHHPKEEQRALNV